MLHRHDETTGHTGPCDAFDLCDGCRVVPIAVQACRMAALREDLAAREVVSV